MSHANHKRGAIVAVCYDGKWSRRVPGIVIDCKRDRLLVRFNEWATEAPNTLEHWFKKRRGYGPTPYLRKWFGGRVAVDASRPQWYSVFPWRDDPLDNLPAPKTGAGRAGAEATQSVICLV